jgi:hypothetical protein
MSSQRTTHVLVVVVLIALLCAVPVAVAAVPYGLESPSEVAVSDRVILIGYENFGFDGVARVERGEELVVRTTAPGSAVYGVDLYDSDRSPVALSDRLRGNDSASLETDSLTPGSYVAALLDEQEVKAVLPVIVEGYAVSAEVPETVGTGTDLTVTTTLERDPASPEASRVELVVTERRSGYILTRRDMEHDGTAYAATVRLAEPGEYHLYVNVRGQKSVRGREVVLGFSDPQAVSVTGTPSAVGLEVPDDAEAGTGTATPSPGTARPTATAAPENVITVNATAGTAAADGGRSLGTTLSMLLALFLGVGLLYWFRR